MKSNDSHRDPLPLNADPVSRDDSQPHGRWGLTTLALLVIANMIGAGLFTTSGFTLNDLGTPARVVLVWCLGGVMAWCGAVGYATATKRLTESGGEYLFLSRWVHPAAGCAAGWVSLVAGFSGATATAALTVAAYLPFEQVSTVDSSSSAWIATIVIVSTGLMHAFARRSGVWAQNTAVIAKLLLIVLLLMAAARGGWLNAWPGSQLSEELDVNHRANWDWHQIPWSSWGLSLMYISFCYSGFNAAVYVAGEARGGAKTVARAMMWGTGIVAALYIALNAVMVYGAPGDVIRNRPDVAAQAIRVLAGGSWEQVFRTTVVLCLVTSVSSMMFAGPPVYAQMARDGALPRFLVPRGIAPIAATFLQIAVSVSIVWVASLRDLLGYLGMTLALSTAGTVAAALAIRGETKTFKTRPSAAIAGSIYVVFTLLTAGLACREEPWQGLATAITLSLGGVYWVVWRRRIVDDQR